MVTVQTMNIRLKKSDLFVLVIILSIIPGLFAYELFKFYDELLVLLLSLIYVAATARNWHKKKPTSIILFAALGALYILYSIAIRSNTTMAVLSDYVVETKPYWAFLFVFKLNLHFSIINRNWLKKVFFVTWVFLSLLILSPETILALFGHPSKYASAIVICSLIIISTYKFISAGMAVAISLLLLPPWVYGLGKEAGFYFISLGICSYYILQGRLQIFRYPILKSKLALICTLLIAILGVIYMAREDIQFYYMDPLMSDREPNAARLVLFYKLPEVLSGAYLPMGRGLASYASYYSAVHYSPLYYSLGIENIDGLTEATPSFISDTYFPTLLGQFGIFGFCCYLSFWIWVITQSLRYWKCNQVSSQVIIILCIFAYSTIHGVAGSTMIQNSGVWLMMILAWVLSSQKQAIQSRTTVDTQ